MISPLPTAVPWVFNFLWLFIGFRTFPKVCNHTKHHRAAWSVLPSLFWWSASISTPFSNLSNQDYQNHSSLSSCHTQTLPKIKKQYVMNHSSWNTGQALNHSSRLKGNVVLGLEVFRIGRLKVSNFICLKLHFFSLYHKVYKTTIVSEVQRSFWAADIRLYSCFHLADRYCSFPAYQKDKKPQILPRLPNFPQLQQIGIHLVLL